jgi:predicted PurR-regulated permease PerM
MRSDPSDHTSASRSVANIESLSSDATPRRLTISISQRTLWVAAGVALVALVAILALTRALGALLLIFFAIILAEAVRPLVMRLERRRVPRPLGALLIYLVIAALLVVIGWLLFTPLATQINEFISNAPAYVAQVQQWAKDAQDALHANDPLSALVDGLAAQLAASLQAALPTLLQFPLTLLSGAFGALISAVVVVTMSIFWLMSADKLRDFSLGLAPERARADGASLFTELGHSLGGWVRGTLVAMLLIGSLTALGLALLGVPYALLLGILAGLTEVIPYLGPWISGTVAVIVTLLALDPLKALEVAVVFVIIQEVESNLVEPFVMSWAVHIDPLFVLIAITIGFEVLGVVGAIIAVPVAGMAQVLMQRVVAPAIRRVTTESRAAPAPLVSADASASLPRSPAPPEDEMSTD